MVIESCSLIEWDFILANKILCIKLRDKYFSFFRNQIIFHSIFCLVICPSYIINTFDLHHFQSNLMIKFYKKYPTSHYGSFLTIFLTFV